MAKGLSVLLHSYFLSRLHSYSALLTAARKWNQPKSPAPEEEIMKYGAHIYYRVLFICKEIHEISRLMDGTRKHYAKSGSLDQEEKHCMLSVFLAPHL